MMDYTNFIAPPEGNCDECGGPMEWCVGGMRCPHENDPNTHDSARDGWDLDERVEP